MTRHRWWHWCKPTPYGIFCFVRRCEFNTRDWLDHPEETP